MRILFTHVNYPSQFRRLVPSLVGLGHDLVFIARDKEWHAPSPDGFRLKKYNMTRTSSSVSLHPYLHRFESAVLNGQGVYRASRSLLNDGWIPDCVVSHIGFGNSLYLRDCFPKARFIGLSEWFYNADNSDVGFLPNHTISDDHRLQIRTWNAECLLECSIMDNIVVPTDWQASQFPSCLRKDISVIHEGVDTALLSKLRIVKKFPDYLPIEKNIKFITYVSRCFEEYRGFPQAAEVMFRLQQLFPNVHLIFVGGDCSAYGPARSDGVPWSQWARNKFAFDPVRTHWMGSLQESDYHQVLAVSDLHLYLTVPFVLSWSLLEAMAAGAPIVASSTPPVEEVLVDGESALLADFFDIDGLTAAASRILNDISLSNSISEASQTASKAYSSDIGLASWFDLINP